MNERMVWIVRFIGIAVLLVLILLMINLYSQLVRLRQQQENAEPAPVKSSSAAIGLECGSWVRSPSPRLATLADPLPRGEGLNVEC